MPITPKSTVVPLSGIKNQTQFKVIPKVEYTKVYSQNYSNLTREYFLFKPRSA